MNAKDITGQTFQRLTVLRYVGPDRYGQAIWLCRCACGKEALRRGGALRSGRVQSCGCLIYEPLAPEIQAVVSAKLRGRKWPNRRVKPMPEAQKAIYRKRWADDPRFATGETNIHCRIWIVRSPRNILYKFRNVQKFVRDHEHLFDPSDVIWRKSGEHRLHHCRAMGGLFSLSPRNKLTKGTWKGWTWVSHYERIKMDNRDPLDRETVGGFKSR